MTTLITAAKETTLVVDSKVDFSSFTLIKNTRIKKRQSIITTPLQEVSLTYET